MKYIYRIPEFIEHIYNRVESFVHSIRYNFDGAEKEAEKMKEKQLLANIQSGEITVHNISTADFKNLMSNPQTQDYGLAICAREYFEETMLNLNQRMDIININDDYNRQTLMETRDLVQMDDNGRMHINLAQETLLFSQYFVLTLYDITEMEPKKFNFIEALKNIVNIRKNIRAIKLNEDIIAQVRNLKKEYVENEYSKRNLSIAISNGWNEMQKSLTSKDFIEEIDYYESVEEIFEMNINIAGCLDGIFADLERDMEKLQKLLEERKKLDM